MNSLVVYKNPKSRKCKYVLKFTGCTSIFACLYNIYNYKDIGMSSNLLQMMTYRHNILRIQSLGYHHSYNYCSYQHYHRHHNSNHMEYNPGIINYLCNALGINKHHSATILSLNLSNLDSEHLLGHYMFNKLNSMLNTFIE